MAVIVSTATPSELLKAMKDEMNKRAIETWAVDTDGDFTHTPPQWANQAWLRPTVYADRLVFNILTPKGTRMNRVTYAVYHGRFIEMLLMHFDLKFTQARASALPETGDIIV